MKVFLSHSSCDKPFVRELARALQEQDAPVHVWLDEAEIRPGDNIVSKIEEGLEADVVLLVLSPDSVASNWVREEWTDAFWEQTNAGRVKLVGVLYKDCAVPRLIRNKKHFDLRTNQMEGFREIRTWLLGQAPAPRRVNRLPQRRPLFIGREGEMAALRGRLREPGTLVHVQGVPGGGKTTLALEFAHRHQGDFEAVWWLACEGQSRAALAGELMRQIGLKEEGDTGEIERKLRDYCGGRRALLVLDNVDDEGPGELVPGGAASVLVTTRLRNLKFLRFHEAVGVPAFTEEQCFELFRKVAGERQVARHEAECRVLFARVGYLPKAVAVAAALIREDARYTIAALAAELPADTTELMRMAIGARSDRARRLLGAMAACAPGGFRLGLAAAMLRLGEKEALEGLQELLSRSLVEELDRDERRYSLHALIRECAGGAEYERAHAEAVRDAFERWEAEWRRCEGELGDFEVAFGWALGHAGEGAGADLGHGLAYTGFQLTRRTGRIAAALSICERIRAVAEAAGDRRRLQTWLGNQALILQAWGRLEEAMALLQKQEAICLDLGDRAGLQASYGNQALILQDWGRLEEAMALLQKQEAICLDLGDRAGLQASYGNQALILQAWGRLEEAMALHKKKEAICLDLGDRAGLQASYGNQALILQAWGRLEEAMALHKKKEAICLDLGDRAGLQRSYGNQALILQAWGRLEEAMALLQKQEAICLDLGDRAGLQASYGNQALILQAWGRLEEAMALHKKQEASCLDLGDRAGLQASYGNQALILQAWGRLEEAMALHKKKEAICLDLGDRAGLQRSYGNQALILQAWGRLEEAMALHKKKEAICLDLGDRAGLQASYGNQALILKAWGRLEEAMALHKKEEAICLDLGDRAGVARSRFNMASILLEQGDSEGAALLMAEAAETFEALGMPRELEIVRENLKALGAGA